MMQLTPHFSLEELIASSIGLRHGIDNTPGAEARANLQLLAKGLERVRSSLAMHNFPLTIDSGYRCPSLNTLVGGAKDSAHLLGFAADFTAPLVGTPERIVNALAADTSLLFDQLIQEGTWVHISFAPTARRQLLTAHFGPGGTTYTAGV